MNLFIGNLNPDTIADGLKTLFSEFGEVVSAKVIYDNATNLSKCFGFVEMADKNAFYEAINNLDQSFFEGNIISVKEAKQNNPTGGRPSGGGYGKKPFRPREGGSSYGGRREGGYNSDRQPREGGYNRESGGYNRESTPREGGYNRESTPGGYNRDSTPREGGYNRDRQPREGGFNRERQPREGGLNRERQPREGGYNREGSPRSTDSSYKVNYTPRSYNFLDDDGNKKNKDNE